MRNVLFIVFVLVSIGNAIGQPTDTLGYSNYLTGTPALYSSPNGGYAFGNNGYGDKAKAQTYSHGSPFVLKEVLMLFGNVTYGSADPESKIVVNIYDNHGDGFGLTAFSDSIAPDSILESVEIPVQQLLDDGNFTVADFSSQTVVITDRFSVGIDLTQLSAGDTVGLMSTTDGDAGGTANAWELTSANVWFVVAQSSYSWGLDVDLAIFPVIDENGPASIHEFGRSQLAVYPNPCSNMLIVNDMDLSSAQVRVFDATGRLVDGIPIDRTSGIADVTALVPGLYVLTITDGTTVRSAQFIKD